MAASYQAASVSRAPNGYWIKGQSGNPSGRRPIPHNVVELAQSKTTLAINTLAEVCQNKKANAGARVMAASVLLDRAWGKAVQRSETKSLNIDLAQLTDAQLFAMLQELNPGAVLPGLPSRAETPSAQFDEEPQGNGGDSGDAASPSHQPSHQTPQRTAHPQRLKRKRKQRLKPRRPAGPIPPPPASSDRSEPGGDGDGSPSPPG